MSLTDQNTSMVNTLGQSALEDLSLQSALQEILNLERQHVIETHTRLIEHTDSDKSSNEGITLEETLGVLVIELEKLTSSTTNLGEDKTNAPDFTLVAQTILAGELCTSNEN